MAMICKPRTSLLLTWPLALHIHPSGPSGCHLVQKPPEGGMAKPSLLQKTLVLEISPVPTQGLVRLPLPTLVFPTRAFTFHPKLPWCPSI